MTRTVKLLALFALITLSSSLNSEQKTVQQHNEEVSSNTWHNTFAATDSTPGDTSGNSGTTNANAPAKSVFPLTVREGFGIVLLVVIAGLANSGGVGGGPLLSSILMIFFQYTPNVSSQVVYTLVFGGSLGNYLNLVGRKNILTSKPLIDYDLALLCMPPMVLGANVGILAERMTAPFLLISGIIIVTSYSFIQILRNSLDLYKVETKRKVQIKQMEEAAKRADDTEKGNITAPLISSDEKEPEPVIGQVQVQEQVQQQEVGSGKVNPESGEVKSAKSISMISEEDNNSLAIGLIAKWEDLDEETKRFVRSETTLFPVQKYFILFSLLVFVMLTAFFKGTDEFPSYVGIPYCGGGYWALFLASLVFPVVIFFVNMKLLNKLVARREKYKRVFKQHKFRLTHKIITKLNIASLIAGFLAGWLGIGGGMIMKPTLLSVGVATQTVSSTAGFFVLQTSLVTLFQALLYQDISTADQAFFFVVSFIGSFLVSWFLNWSIKKTGRPSIILFALIFVLAISILATPIFEAYINWDNPKALLQFNSFC